jgi:hypothetical protein
MSESLYLIHGTDSYQVHEIAGERWATLLGGFGMPPVSHVTQRSPRQDGDTLLDVRLEPRTVVVGIVNQQATRAAYWTERRALLAMLKRFANLRLRFVNDTESFDLDVVYEAGAELSTEESIGLRDFSAAVQLVAHEPVWYATTPTSLVVGVPAMGDAGVMPWVLPITFGVSSINTDILVPYAGTWKAYPQVDVRGPITNPVITNNATDETLTIETDIPDDEVVRIDLATNVKTVRNVTTDTNWMQYLSDDSDLATWHLAPDPEAEGGDNALHFQGTNGGINTAITLRWHDRHIGL